MNFYGKAVAALAEAYKVGEELLPKETGIELDLATGEIAPAPKNWWLANP